MADFSSQSQVPSVGSDQYTINFLWINLDPQDRAEDSALNIFGSGNDLMENRIVNYSRDQIQRLERMPDRLTDDDGVVIETEYSFKDLIDKMRIKETKTYGIIKWAEANPGTSINLWFDSALTTQKAVQNTFNTLQKLSESRNCNMHLRDIRQLKNIPEQILYSLHPGTQVYFRVDILKALIAEHMMKSSEENARYFVFTDFDITPQNRDELFDTKTMTYFLNEFGYVGGSWGICFENNFFIFDRTFLQTLHLHREYIIDYANKELLSLRDRGEKKLIGGNYVYDRYGNFHNMLLKAYNKKITYWPPQKMLETPQSVYRKNTSRMISDHFSREEFKFKGESNIPYLKYGRANAFQESEEIQLPNLSIWQAEPLNMESLAT